MSESSTPKIVSGPAAVIARRYAHAMFRLADETKQLDTVASDLKALEEMLRESEDLRKVVHHTRLKEGEVKNAMKKLAEAAKLSDLTAKFLVLLVSHKRLSSLGNIITMYLNELAVHRNEHTAVVTAAQALTDAQVEKIAGHFGKVLGGKVSVVVKEDKSLLGGLKIKLGSRLFDASLKGKLERLERQLKSQGEAA